MPFSLSSATGVWIGVCPDLSGPTGAGHALHLWPVLLISPVERLARASASPTRSDPEGSSRNEPRLGRCPASHLRPVPGQNSAAHHGFSMTTPWPVARPGPDLRAPPRTREAHSVAHRAFLGHPLRAVVPNSARVSPARSLRSVAFVRTSHRAAPELAKTALPFTPAPHPAGRPGAALRPAPMRRVWGAEIRHRPLRT